MATVSLFVGVTQWNSWFDAMLYVTKKNMQPIQMILQQILLSNSASELMAQAQHGQAQNRAVSPISIQMATLIVTTLPIVIIYPFLQKYFVKGMMIGAVKAQLFY